MKPKELIFKAKIAHGDERDALIKKAFSINYRAAALSFKSHFWDEFSTLGDEGLFGFIYPERATRKVCDCGTPLEFKGVQRGYGKFCSHSCYSMSDDSKSARKKTNLQKYGGLSPLSDKSVLDKCQQTNLLKYGQVCSAQGAAQILQRIPKLQQKAPITQQKAKNTLFNKTGVQFPGQLPQTILASKETAKRYWLSQVDRLVKELNECGFALLSDFVAIDEPVALRHSCGAELKSTIKSLYKCPSCHIGARSVPERRILDFVRTLENSVISADRTTIKPLEIDILVPAKGIGIEVNGSYWHRDAGGATPIKKKTQLCADKGIKLLHFWDYEICEKFDIVSSIVKNALGHSKRLGARELLLDTEVPPDECAEFLNSYHIQGNANGKIRIGLRDKSRMLMSVIVISKSRFNKNADYEILRSCTKNGFSIMGGLSRMMSVVPRGRYVTYADLRFFDGKSYEKVGFKRIGTSPPNYQWIKGDVRLSRYQTQKHRLSTLLEEFDETKTEVANMTTHGFYKISDCGNGVFVGDFLK